MHCMVVARLIYSFLYALVSNGDTMRILCSMGSEGIAAMVYRSGTEFIRHCVTLVIIVCIPVCCMFILMHYLFILMHYMLS
jgi:hypothetical protein